MKAINATPNMVKAVMAAMAASSGRLSPARKKGIRQEKKKIIFSGKERCVTTLKTAV